MQFEDSELDVIVNKKIDKIVFFSNDKPMFSVNINSRIEKKIESDPNLKKALIAEVLRSTD